MELLLDILAWATWALCASGFALTIWIVVIIVQTDREEKAGGEGWAKFRKGGDSS